MAEVALDTESASSAGQASPTARSAWRGRRGWFGAYEAVDASTVALFRMAFGVVMLYQVISYEWNGLVSYLFIDRVFRFSYYGFSWVEPWPGDLMHVHFTVLAIAAIGVAIGLWYRVATATLWLGFTYVFLLEKGIYLNHFYLICLMAFVMIFVPAGRCWSIDARIRPRTRSDVIPAWALWLVRFHVGLPYVFGGIAKLNGDWLRGQPMHIWLNRSDITFLGPWKDEYWMALVFSWGGLLFDLAVVPLLLFRRTRWLGLAWAAAFHLFNHRMFDIGVFPWLMLAGTFVFFPPEWPRRVLSRLRVGLRPVRRRIFWSGPRTAAGKLLAGGLVAYVVVQLLLPFRHFLYPGNPSWTEEGHRFAWHMMLRDKENAIRFLVTDRRTGRTGAVNLRRWLRPTQLDRMGRDPEMIREFAHFIAGQYHEMGFEDIEIRVLALSSLNGRKPQHLIDPTVDLLTCERTMFHQPWVVPLVEPFRYEPWRAPLSEWELYVSWPPERPEVTSR